jgi:hypothetical protein
MADQTVWGPSGLTVLLSSSFSTVTAMRPKPLFCLKGDDGGQKRPMAEFMGALWANPDSLRAEHPVDALARCIGVRRLSSDARLWLEDCLAEWRRPG